MCVRRLIVLTLLCLLPLLPRAGRAQENQPDPSEVVVPSSESAQQWLASSDPRVQAWGAHAVLDSHNTALLPAVIDALTRKQPANPQPTGNQTHAQAAMLDALIQLHGNLPVESLAGLNDSLWTQKLILLARLPWSDTEPVWSKLYQSQSPRNDAESRAAAEMLARNGSDGFAARLLRTIAVQVFVNVHDPGSASGLGLGFGSSCCGSGVRPEKPWPAMGGYLFDEPRGLLDPPLADATLWLAGRDPIYLVRQLTTTGWYGRCGGGLRPLDDALRSHLAGRLLGDESSPFPETAVNLDIPFSSREVYRQAVVEAVDAVQSNFVSVAQRLTAQGLLTETERQSIDLPIQLTLNDTRSKPAEDLPTIAFRKPVSWTAQPQ